MTAHPSHGPDHLDPRSEFVHRLDELQQALAGGAPRGKLREVHMKALQIVAARGTVIVGDIQRALGVLPAQMSRVVRKLEGGAEPLVECSINPADKRKIDVSLTPAGRRIVEDAKRARADKLIDIPPDLLAEANTTLAGIMEQIRGRSKRATVRK